MAGFKFPSESDAPIIELKFDYPQLQKIIKDWLIKHYSIIIVTSVTSVVAAVIGTVIANVIVVVIPDFLQFISNLLATSTYGEPLPKLFQEVEPVLFCMLLLTCLIPGSLFIALKLTSKMDVHNFLQCSVVPSFGIAFMVALDIAANNFTAISMGTLSGLMIGGLITRLEQERFDRLQPKTHWEEVLYNKLTDLLSSLDTDDHKNKVQSESNTNSSLSLVGNSIDLQEVKDPVGDKHITLDYTLRDKEVEIGGERYVLLGYQKSSNELTL